MKTLNAPYASVDFLVSCHRQPIETIVKNLVGTTKRWQENDDETPQSFRILAAWVDRNYFPEQFPDGYVHVDAETV